MLNVSTGAQDMKNRSSRCRLHNKSLYTFSLLIQCYLSKEDRLFLCGNTKLIVEDVVPHIFPIGDDSVFNRVFECKDNSFGLSFISGVANIVYLKK